MGRISKKPKLVYNSIASQLKTAISGLTVQEWNNVVNVLRLQSNYNTEYLEQLHTILFGQWSDETTGYVELEKAFGAGLISEGLLTELIKVVHDIKTMAVVSVGHDVPTSDNVVLWIETED